jgi:hypothetical protein
LLSKLLAKTVDGTEKVEKTLSSVLQNLILSVDSLSATINDGFTQYLDLRIVKAVKAFLLTELDP